VWQRRLEEGIVLFELESFQSQKAY